MPEARLQLDIPEDVWIGTLSRQYDQATFRILAALSDGDGGVGLAEIRAADIDELLEDMRAAEDVLEVNVLDKPDDKALVQFETTHPLLLLAAQDSGIPLEMPFELSNGSAVWEITASSDRLSALGTQLRSFDIPFTIDYIQQDVEKGQLLTDSQAEIVETAIDEGYYDTPRTCSLTDLAAELDRAKSTVSETLHRAESKIIKQYDDREDGEGQPALTPIQ
jgi:predicted DNA binding protein